MISPETLASLTAPRLVLITTSARVAPGLLSAQAWAEIQQTGTVRAAPGNPHLPHLRDAWGLDVDIVEEDEPDPRALVARLVSAVADEGDVVWLMDPEGDADLARALAELAERGDAPVIEVLPGSYDLPGARLIDLVATMDRLRSPGGCPWDAEQTHESLTTYLLEETYETLEAIETGDRGHLREELGDLLLQVMFHSRIAAEHPQDPWTVDDVAGDIVAKLVRRHPHVFGPDAVGPDVLGPNAASPTAAAVEANWHTSKAAEKGRTSAVDGVPATLPALALAAKLMQRAQSHGLAVEVVDDDSIGSALMALVGRSREAGVDPEAELRSAARRFAVRVRAAEEGAAASAAKEPPRS